LPDGRHEDQVLSPATTLEQSMPLAADIGAGLDANTLHPGSIAVDVTAALRRASAGAHQSSGI